MNDPSQIRASTLSARMLAGNTKYSRSLARPNDFWSWPEWYVDLISKIDLVDRSDEIIYFSSDLSAEGPVGGDIYGLTRSQVIRVSVAEKDGARVDVSLEMWSRKDLVSLFVLDADDRSAFEPTTATAPSSLRLQLQYRDRAAIVLPVGDGHGRASGYALGGMFTSLVTDLN